MRSCTNTGPWTAAIDQGSKLHHVRVRVSAVFLALCLCLCMFTLGIQD